MQKLPEEVFIPSGYFSHVSATLCLQYSGASVLDRLPSGCSLLCIGYIQRSYAAPTVLIISHLFHVNENSCRELRIAISAHPT